MWEQFVTLFTEMGWVSAVLLSLGIILSMVELFTPGLGVPGICGVVCVVGGIIARMIEGGSFTQLFMLIIIFIFVFILLFLLMVRSAKYGWLSKSPIVENNTAVAKDYDSEENNPNMALVGKIAKTASVLKPVGKIVINNITYDAMAESGYIEKDVEVEVIQVDGLKIVVKQI